MLYRLGDLQTVCDGVEDLRLRVACGGVLRAIAGLVAVACDCALASRLAIRARVWQACPDLEFRLAALPALRCSDSRSVGKVKFTDRTAETARDLPSGYRHMLSMAPCP